MLWVFERMVRLFGESPGDSMLLSAANLPASSYTVFGFGCVPRSDIGVVSFWAVSGARVNKKKK
jgi:hypothetical protein